MNRLAQIEAALRDMRAAFDDEDWDALAEVPDFDAPAIPEEPVDPDRARELLTGVNRLLAELKTEARNVRAELQDQPTFKRAARAYLASSAATR